VACFIVTCAYAWACAIFVRVTINIVEQAHRLAVDWAVEMDRPSGPYRLHGLSRSGASYMLQIILRTNRTVMDCQTLPYTLSLYGHMLIIAIIVLILLMSIVLNFYCSLLDADCCMIGLLTVPLMALSPTASIVSKHLVIFT